MPDDFSIEVQGLDQVVSRIKSLPAETKHEVLTDTSEYAMEVFRADQPPPNYVTRTSAYGQTFQSDKQRRWFFAALARGEISVPYHRTGGLAAAWGYSIGPDQVKIYNTAPGAPYVVGFAAQSRHEAKVGWHKVTDTLSKYLDFRNSKFRAVVMGAVQKAIRKLQLG